MIEHLIQHILGRKVEREKTAKRWRLIRCDDCSSEFVYEQKVTGSGSSWNRFNLQTRQAFTEAGERAEIDLQAKLAGDTHSPVSCPNCGAFPKAVKEEATNEVTRTWTSRLFIVGVALMIVVLGGLLISVSLLPAALSLYILPLVMVVSLVGFFGAPLASYFFFRPRDINASHLKAQRLASPKADSMLLSEFQSYFDQLPPDQREEILQSAHAKAAVGEKDQAIQLMV